MINGIDNDTAVACLQIIDKHSPPVRSYKAPRVDFSKLRAAGFEIGRRIDARPKWQRPGRRRKRVCPRGRKAAYAYLRQRSAKRKSQAYFGKIFGISQVSVSLNVRQIRLGRALLVNSATHKDAA